MELESFKGKTVSSVETSDASDHIKIVFTDNTELVVVRATNDEQFCTHSNFLAVVEVPKCPFGDHPAYVRKNTGQKAVRCGNCGKFLPDDILKI